MIIYTGSIEIWHFFPNEIAVCQDINGKDIQVNVVNNFKLLGLTIDNKLNFSEHVSNVKKIVNRKLFSIKKTFLFMNL
jgi:hypothetical protein